MTTMIRSRVDNIALPSGSGNDAYPMDLRLNEAGEYILEAWISNFGGANVHILEGQLSLTECEQIVKSAGKKDMLMTVTGTGPVFVPYGGDSQKITVYFEGVNESGLTQVVTVELKNLKRV